MLLIDAKTGENLKLENFSQNQSVYFKLISLGVLPGDQVQVVGRAPFGGPISIKHGNDTFFALRKSEAGQIIVSKMENK